MRSRAFFLAAALLPLAAGAANVVTDGNMEAAGIASWPHTNVSGTASSAKATDQVQTGLQSLKTTSPKGNGLSLEWYNAQTVGTITAGSAVTLSLWYGAQYSNTAGASGTLAVEVKRTADSWSAATTLWSQPLTPSAAFTSGTVTALDVSGAFTATASYDLRLRFVGTTGSNKNADLQIWWDDVVLDQVVVQPGTTVGAVSATPSGCSGLAVTASYTGDPNANNTLSYRTRTPSGTGSWSAPVTRPHSASPYAFTLSSLTPGATYDVEVTWVDPDGVTGTNPQTASNVQVSGACTGAGTVSAAQATGATPSIAVSAPYTFDTDGDNTLSYRTRTPSGTGTWSAPTAVAHSASPYGFTLSGLTCGAAYDVEVTYQDPDGIVSGSAVQTVSNVQLTRCTLAGAPSAVVDACNRITASAPYTQDSNGDGTVAFERGASGTGPWTVVAGCGAVGGPSPRTCADTGVAASSTTWYRVTYGDADGVGGTAQQVIGGYTTSACAVPQVTVGTPSATPTGCGTASVSAPFTGDSTNNSSTRVEWTTSGTWTVACASLTGASPRVCNVSGLPDGPVTFRVTFTDPDGVLGTNPATTSATLPACRVTAGVPTAVANSCSQVTVSSSFTGDSNGNSTTTFKRGSSPTGPFNTTVCSAVTGSPRTCVDGTVAQSTQYYYQVDYVDADGVAAGDLQVASVTTPACPPVLTLGDPGGQPTGTPVAAGSSVNVGRLRFTVNTGTATVTALGITNLGTAVPGDDVLRLQLYDEFDGALLGTTVWDGSAHRAGGLNLPVTAGTPRTVRVELTVATGATAGRTFRMQVAAANVAVGGESTVTGGPVNGSTTLFTVASGALQGNANPAAPMVLIVNPINGAAVTGPSFRVQVHVFNPAGLGALTGVSLSTNGGSTFSLPLAQNTRHNVGLNAAIYEATVTLAPGPYSLVAQASNSVPLSTRSGVAVISVSAAGTGDGHLLVRDNSAQLCTDCHALQTHSSQGTGQTRYGAWGVTCRDCHTPHGTTNVALIKKTITPPSVQSQQSAKPVRFSKRTGHTNSAAVADATYANADNSGPCQVCHTRTQSLGGTPRFRNTGNADQHFTADAATQPCTDCHTHSTGFKGKVCVECHLDASADTDNYAADSIAAKISQTEWLAYGHGKTSGLYPDGLNPAANFDGEGAALGDRGCMYCHDGGTGHNQGSNRFRLANVSGPDGKNGACLVCHKAGATGFDPDGAGTAYNARTATRKISASHAGNKHAPSAPSPNENGGAYCWDCHDPHGDLSALGNPLWFMLQKQPVRSTDAEGLPTALANPIEFRKEAGGDSAASPVTSSTKLDFQDYIVPGRALCGNCHTGTGANPVSYYTRDTPTVQHRSSNGTENDAPNDRCTDCHRHDAMFNPPRCDACHRAPPSVGKHDVHDRLPQPTDALEYTATASHGDASKYGFACAQCHQGTHSNNPSAGTLADPFETDVVFARGGSYTPAAPSSDPGPDGKYYSYSNGTCATYCHSNASPLPGGTPTYAAPTWQQAATMTCTSCHGTGGAASTLSPAHRLHTDPAKYGYGCVACHSATVADNATVSDKTRHVDGSKDVVFSTGGTYAGAPGYTCASTTCHTNGAGGPPVGTLSWNTSGGLFTCDGCHGGNAARPTVMSSGKHPAHVNNAAVLGTNLGCVKCHSATVSSDTTIATFGNHVNGTANVAGASLSYSALTCTNTYCHSSGQATPAYRTVRWDAAAWSNKCNGCHGTGTTTGAPDYASGNSHAAHVSAGASSCTACHNDTTTDGTSIASGSTLHLDGVRDVRIAAAYDLNGGTKADNYNASTRTCSSVSCHGSAGQPVWGGTVSCLNCHSGTQGGALGDGTPNGVGAYWSARGHGASAGGSLTSARGGCDYCHQLDAPHTPASATNPYRLRFSATTNALCNQCHLAGDPGIGTDSAGVALSGGVKNGAKDVDAAHDGTKHQAGEGGILCWDCHDPHGVQTNLVMVKQQVSVTSNAYGVPATTAPVTFTDKTTAGQCAGCFTASSGVPRQGICQACHSPTKGTDATVGSTDYWRSDGTDKAANPSAHNANAVCTTCHQHKNKFAGAGGDCLACHSSGGAGTTGASSRRAVEVDFGKRSHHVGAMDRYPGQTTLGGTLTNNDCVVCHAEGTLSGGEVNADARYHKNGKIDLKDADSPDLANPGVFVYDKDAVAAAAGAVANWGSVNATWRYETSGKSESTGALVAGKGLDRFCLSCHDSNGASTVYAQGEAGATSMNPFKDSKITNEVDQLDRGPIVDVKSMVSGSPPPRGLYSVHAIRGQSASRYTSSTISQSLRSATYNALLDTGVTDPFDVNAPAKQTLWNDTSVMGCADCHTTDGANGASGNAHGADGEYLLKDRNGTAALGTGKDLATTVVCMRCHTINVGGSGSHSGSASNFIDTVGLPPGTARNQRWYSSGNQFGIFCLNCHGGAADEPGQALDPLSNGPEPSGFGRIHGTDQVFKTGSGGAGANPRRAYRFTNGAALRYYQPGTVYSGGEWDWDNSAKSATCYTLGVSTDSWSSCTQHSGAKAYTKQGTRPLNY